MYQFLESIKFENQSFHHLPWHQKRVNETFANFYPAQTPFNLEEIFNQKELNINDLCKARFLYNENDYFFEIEKYQPRKILGIEFIEIDFDYNFKFLNRTKIDEFTKYAGNQEVIFTKNGFILDASYANIALLKDEKWYTPKTFLLNGTCRQRLLSENLIEEIEIHKSDLQQFTKLSFINALNDLDKNTLNL